MDSPKLDALLYKPCSNSYYGSASLPKWPRKQSLISWGTMPPDPLSLECIYIHVRHPCNPPSENPGYGTGNCVKLLIRCWLLGSVTQTERSSSWSFVQKLASHYTHTPKIHLLAPILNVAMLQKCCESVISHMQWLFPTTCYNLVCGRVGRQVYALARVLASTCIFWFDVVMHELNKQYQPIARPNTTPLPKHIQGRRESRGGQGKDFTREAYPKLCN